MIPKSLHTVTVFSRVAAAYRYQTGCADDEAIAYAVDVLGYSDEPDTYGLVAASLKKLPRLTATPASAERIADSYYIHARG